MTNAIKYYSLHTLCTVIVEVKDQLLKPKMNNEEKFVSNEQKHYFHNIWSIFILSLLYSFTFIFLYYIRVVKLYSVIIVYRKVSKKKCIYLLSRYIINRKMFYYRMFHRTLIEKGELSYINVNTSLNTRQ